MASNVGSRAFQNARQQKKLKKQAETQLVAAFTAYHAGRHAETQSVCRQLLEEQPNNFEALHILGVSITHCGRFAEGAEVLQRAVAIDPRSAEAHSNLGFALLNLNRYADARKHLEKAIALQPNFPTAQRNLANALLCLEQNQAAASAFERILARTSDDAEAWSNLGVAQLRLEKHEACIKSCERALALRPGYFDALFNLGQAHAALRHLSLAQTAFTAALAIKPDAAEVLAERGQLYLLTGRHDLAEADFEAAVARNPKLLPGWLGKAQTNMFRGNVAQAITACRYVLEQDGSSELGLTLLGTCLGRLGDAAGAIQHFDRAIAVNPDYQEAIIKKIFYQDFLSDADFAAQQATRRSWWETVGAKLPRRKLAPRALDPDRRLVVGYVSADFRMHSAAFAFLPVLRNHDKTKIQVNCYSSSEVRDQYTLMFQSLADVWCDANNLSDDELADRIQADGVDILVDLSGYTTGNRMPVFARKPAPIQVTAWGSGTGTGVATMDYFFADPVTIPQQARHLFAETVYDLPSVITIDPITDIALSPLPMRANGHVTFGVFNRIDKISDEAVAVWSRLLREIESAKLLIKHTALDEAFLRDALVGRFVAHDIAADRITCLGSSQRTDHLRAFGGVDISLDPFPQNGGISTWESLYMGVPVVAKLGRGASSRAAGAILTAIGLNDWVAEDDEGYVRIVKHFASQPAALQELRAGLPARIAQSAAGNVAVYTQQVEAGYRQFWRTYCAAAGAK